MCVRESIVCELHVSLLSKQGHKTFYASLFTLNFYIFSDEYDSEGSEASEDDARPLTRNELQKRVMRTVKKRESAARKEGFRYDLTTNREKSKAKKDKK